jgi:serine/threonine protein kinase
LIIAGTRLGRYEIRSKIGEGGMGEVYLAQDTRLDRKVALKILPAELAANRDRMRRFVQEAKAASALNHPNIITIHEIDESGSTHFIATEFIEGETLRDRLHHSPPDLTQALDIAIQVAAALVAAHKAGIIHRDIKPENVMVRGDDQVKVVDFGLAKLIQPEASEFDSSTPTALQNKTESGTIMGTIAYMSPEQARGVSLDPRTDIWSLGVVLYEMIAGRSPFAAETSSDTVVAILQNEPPSLVSGNAPEELDWILTKALTKEREDRYQTAREMLKDLRRLKERLSVAGEIERSHPANKNLAHQFHKNRQSKQLWWISAAVLVLLLASIVGVVVWKKSVLRAATTSVTRVVVLMDSPLPDRVYDPETRKNGGTNADDITDILRDLPITIEKENTSPFWHREDQVLRESPTLIVIHRSCFAAIDPSGDEHSPIMQVADSKIEGFLGYVGLGNKATNFLVYTRRVDDGGAWKSDIEKRFPQLKNRVFTLHVPGGSEHATFRDPATARLLRQQVETILSLH